MAKILVISGSNRSGSFNSKLAAAAAKEFALLGADVTRISLLDYPLPLYDGDLEAKEGVPRNVRKLADLISLHDGVFLASPEYNASVSPLLKNMVDWVSRVREKDGKPFAPWKSVTLALGAASPGKMGGVRGLNHLRAIMVSIGSLVITEQVLVSEAKDAFDENAELTAERSATALTALCRSLIQNSQC